MSKNNCDQNVVRVSKLYLIVGMIGLFFFVFIWIFAGKPEDEWWVRAGWAAFGLLDVILILRYLVWRITYNETEFTVRNMFGVSHTYRYSEITAKDSGVMSLALFVGKKKIELGEVSVDAMAFLFFADQQYSSLTGDRNGLPEAPPKKDLYNGNIEGGTPMFILLVLVFCLGLGIFVFLLIDRESMAQGQETSSWLLLLFMFLLVLGLLYYIVGGLIVGRHPERYSKKTVTRFFKEEYVRPYNRLSVLLEDEDPLSWEELKDEMYNKDLDSFQGDIVLMDYSDDDSRRFAITKTENGYSYAFQRLFRREDDEMDPDDTHQGVWRNLPDCEAKQFFFERR